MPARFTAAICFYILMKDKIVLTNDYISQRGLYLSAF